MRTSPPGLPQMLDAHYPGEKGSLIRYFSELQLSQ